MHIARQQGISLVGLIVLLAVGGFVAVLALKIVPTYTEYRAIQNAIVSAKAGGGTVLQMQKAFDASATVGYINAINGKDLIISRGENGETEISFAYEKKIPLLGPASLLLEYEGSTAKHGMPRTDQ